MTTDEKRQQLQTLFAEMETINLPLREESPLIPGEGNPDAKVLFIGEAGGFNEAKLKRPFVGRAGALLDKLFSENGMERGDVWITNVVKARPPQNRDPLPDEIEAYRPYLERELSVIQPQIIVTLGRFAMNWFLPEATISQTHGYAMRRKDGVTIFPLYHPAAALRNGNMLEALQQDFEKLAKMARGESLVDESFTIDGSDESKEKEIEQTQQSLF